MRYVKWIFIIALLGMLTSFVGKDKSSNGLNVGNAAPDFCIPFATSSKHAVDLSDLKGKYVLLSFWASYDAESRLLNAALCHTLYQKKNSDMAMISVSFDEYQSVFEEAIRMDRINMPICFAETNGKHSVLFRKYRLKAGFGNYLLDDNGIIIAKDISVSELSGYLDQLAGK